MTLQLEGAKEAKNEIKKFHLSLNQENLVPEQCYRRNHRNYPMVSYASQIVALFISKNYEVIPVFIDRAYSELERNHDQPVTEKYRAIVHDYLCQITYYLIKFTNVENERIESIVPEILISCGTKKAPEINHETLQFENT